jgi:dihydropteroate synthase
MGIINVTPDSFYEGSRTLDTGFAIDRALAMMEEGADILDFGAESTRPGSTALTTEEELRRLVPVIREIRKRSSALVSIDTRHGEVARACLEEGADIVNDISALNDPTTAKIVCEYGAALVLMHMKGEPGTMQVDPRYEHCGSEVKEYLFASVVKALEAGIKPASIVLDPGIGFGKNLGHNIELLSTLHLLTDSEYPVLVGVSRKRCIGEITGRAVEDRLAGSIGAACAAWSQGADIFRVHDVAPTKDALAVYSAINRER